MSVVLFVILFATAFWQVDGWSYEDEYDWDLEYPQCNGDFQSPIELKYSQSTDDYAEELAKREFHNYFLNFETVDIQNNGHTVNIVLTKPAGYKYPDGDSDLPYIIKGGLREKYVAESLHFHWGYNSERGSEHIIEKKRYSMEMHIVHRNSEYQTIDEAMNQQDGLAVLGVMFQAKNANSDFKGLQKVVRSLSKVQAYGKKSTISDFKLTDLLADVDLNNFYFYHGSLTTPPCSESVWWTVFNEQLNMSEDQIKEFRKLLDENDKPLVDNYRSIQDFEGEVYRTEN